MSSNPIDRPGREEPKVVRTPAAADAGGATTSLKPGIVFELDGARVEAMPDETIWAVAQRLGTHIPHLCHKPAPGYRPDGNCRACMVEIEGERVLAASCKRTPGIGMKVKTAADRAVKARAMVMELLVTDQPSRATSHDPDSHFWSQADFVSVSESRFPAAERWI